MYTSLKPVNLENITMRSKVFIIKFAGMANICILELVRSPMKFSSQKEVVIPFQNFKSTWIKSYNLGTTKTRNWVKIHSIFHSTMLKSKSLIKGPLKNISSILYYKIQSVCVIVCTCGIGPQTMHTKVMKLLQLTQWV